ncbi:hypothetical protein BUALT_Bualt07G0003400 [Buddleja alternifolia]|uniref:DNA-binding protein RHL1 n=1 Tax=Buddleja alternifolia TaxID=168488 RepID=A0AAV6XHH9_9LAMI|nr:hypothetical protein BUALT_Bualt07G0003400 [Buddleja alternifolia]
MGRGGKKEGNAAADPEAEERGRLKKIAFSTNILSQNPVKVGPSTALAPSKTVIKHHGKDILRKSQRKNKYLFSFPGLLGSISGGKIGELKDLGTKNPILYLDFPQGQMKLFGTIIYPKNRYLTLQFSRGGKNVTCDDYFDNMIVFSDAWWVGTKEENPEELRLPFPKELNLEKHAEYDFKGGVGATSDKKQVSGRSAVKCLEQESPKIDLEDDLADSQNDYKELAEVTPTRQSARTAGKTFKYFLSLPFLSFTWCAKFRCHISINLKFAEASSGDDFVVNGAETSEEEDDKVDTETRKNYTSTDILVIVFIVVPKHTQTESSCPLVFEVDKEGIAKQDPASGKNKRTAKAKDLSDTGHTSLVQTTLSSLFKKVEDTKAQKDVKEKRKSKTKASGASSSEKVQANLLPASQSSDPNSSTHVEEDDIEEFSTTSQDMDASDEDWIV